MIHTGCPGAAAVDPVGPVGSAVGPPATVVQRLLAAGALLTGKTNMDQFATGLVGTRSPYGACHSVFSGDHVSGGSSSGSAVAVAAGVVPLALGTDTAGSGRVPAAF
ncbi:MAG TPA: amidase family protein, partial [Catenuloplanes sp.]